MESKTIKTTILNHGFAGEVRLEETSDGQKYVHKEYSTEVLEFPGNSNLMDDEWNTLVYLYNKGYNVPQPIRRTKNGMYMQYIENGALWEAYENADSDAQKEVIEKFTKLLYNLHILEVTDAKQPDSSFLQNEIAEIKQIIDEKGLYQLNNYMKTLERLKTISVSIAEQSQCYIHRDYHPWNVLLDKNNNQYAIDFVLKQGDYRFDAAWTYMLMSRTGFPEFAEYFLSEYKDLQPDVLIEFEFFKQLANFRWLVTVKPPISSKKGENTEQAGHTDFFQHMINIAESEMVVGGLLT